MAGIVHDLSATGKGGVHFVVSTGVEKPGQELRRLIRSHVMFGKNKGKTLPPRKKKAKAKAPELDDSHDLSPSIDTTSMRTAIMSPTEGLTKYNTSFTVPARPAIPHQFGSFLTAVQFADAAVDSKTVEVVIQFSSISKQTLFPKLEPYIFFNRRAESWIMPLTYDPAFLHTMIFTSQYYFHFIAARQNSKSSVLTPVTTQQWQPHHFHLVRTLQLLRERFADSDERLKTSFTTAAAVMGLVGHALMNGDKRSAGYHMEGLGKIVRMRGGFRSFVGSEKLLLEIFRCDLGIALHGGSTSVFFRNIFLEPFVLYPNLRLFFDTSNLTLTKYHNKKTGIDEDMDESLLEAWKTMSDFCTLIDIAAHSEQRISTETFSNTMSSVMYRLIVMSFPFYTKNEAIRLGLLAFTSKVFLHWGHLGLCYPRLSSDYKHCLHNLKVGDLPPQIMIWLLIIGAITLFDIEDNDGVWLMPLLQQNLRMCKIDGWDEMKEMMGNIMWIGIAFDKDGKRIFSSLKVL